MEKFSATLAQGFRTTLFIALPAMAGLILIRKPLIAVIFQRGNFGPADTNQVATTLTFYSLGLSAYFMHHLLARAYFALQDAKTPVKISVRMVAVNFVLNCILVWPLGVGGLALSTAFCASLQAAILLRLLLKRYKLSFQKGLLLSLIKSTTAMVTMILGGWATLRLLAEASSVTQLVAAVSVCGVLYVVTSIFLRNKELSALLR
jgi:putative peptidoglycan lipid II flippase